MANNAPTKVSHVSRPAQILTFMCPESVPESVPDFAKVSRMAVFRYFVQISRQTRRVSRPHRGYESRLAWLV
jgi:hypothetical protein